MTRDDLIAKIHGEVSVDGMLETIDRYVTERVEQLEIQLAGCATAALGWNQAPAKQGDYGWSPAYQDVLRLRQRVDEQAERERALVELTLNIGFQAGEVQSFCPSVDDVLAEFVKRQASESEKGD